MGYILDQPEPQDRGEEEEEFLTPEEPYCMDCGADLDPNGFCPNCDDDE